MNTTVQIRQGALNNIHSQLYALVDAPPRKDGSEMRDVDLLKVSERLNDVKPFWDAYLAVSKIKTDHYALRNMTVDERTKYNACKWWITLLETTIAARAVGD